MHYLIRKQGRPRGPWTVHPFFSFFFLSTLLSSPGRKAMAAASQLSLWRPQLPPLRSSLFLTSRSSHSCRPLKRCAQAASSSSSLVTKQEEEGSADEPDALLISFKDDPNFRGCKACGRQQVESGCNGEGRMQGGIATVPGFGWWPIKAYRPCPAFVASGGRYRRHGQSMDDVVSGRGRKRVSSSSSSSAKNNN